MNDIAAIDGQGGTELRKFWTLRIVHVEVESGKLREGDICAPYWADR